MFLFLDEKRVARNGKHGQDKRYQNKRDVGHIVTFFKIGIDKKYFHVGGLKRYAEHLVRDASRPQTGPRASMKP
jgi:hypothetical protein